MYPCPIKCARECAHFYLCIARVRPLVVPFRPNLAPLRKKISFQHVRVWFVPLQQHRDGKHIRSIDERLPRQTHWSSWHVHGVH
jgi:hypothetical protein